MLKTIAIINNKGGVGKTTTTVNLAAGLARRGRRVLLVDLDSQGSASLSLGVRRSELSPSAADVLYGKVNIEDAVRATDLDNFDLLTGDIDLANADIVLKQKEHGQYRLDKVLSQVRDDYQVILIDCAPSTTLLSICALVAADGFIVPVTPYYLSLEGVISLGGVVQRVRNGLGQAAPLLGVLVTKVDPNVEAAQDFTKMRNHYGDKVFDTEIRRDPRLIEAPSHDLDIFRYAPDSPGAEDYGQLVDELEQRLDRYETLFGDAVT